MSWHEPPSGYPFPQTAFSWIERELRITVFVRGDRRRSEAHDLSFDWETWSRAYSLSAGCESVGRWRIMRNAVVAPNSMAAPPIHMPVAKAEANAFPAKFSTVSASTPAKDPW